MTVNIREDKSLGTKESVAKYRPTKLNDRKNAVSIIVASAIGKSIARMISASNSGKENDNKVLDIQCDIISYSQLMYC